MIDERYELSMHRIREIAKEQECKEPFADYFKKAAEFLLLIDQTVEMAKDGSLFTMDLPQKKELNHRIYEETLPEHYEQSYCNPAYAVKCLSKEYGQILSALFAELHSLIPYAFECKELPDRMERIVIRLELFVEIYVMFVTAFKESSLPERRDLQETYASFAFDYAEDMMESAVFDQFSLENDFATKIVMESDLSDPSYLYSYGEYITENEEKMSRFLAKLPQESIQKMADTFTEGYRIGFLMTGKDISIKKTVNIRYFIGFERVVRAAVHNFEKIGLKTLIYRAQPSFFLGRGIQKNGYFATIANKQFECDHEYDKALYFTSKYVTRKLEAYKAALEKYRVQANDFGGPAVIESFGEPPFSPASKKESLQFSAQERKLSVEYAAKAGELLNHYVKGEERSFTIIAFPIPQIGERFEEIFEETIKINTLDYQKYRDIQQTIIDTLDKASYVRVKGCGENKTSLTVALWKLKNPEKETIFENCVADVNIPVGEVFTSPVLKGTNGVLHVTEVFLNGLQYKDLSLTFEDGMVTEYSCSNFKDSNEGKKYIKDHVLHQHDTLPMGEFAIGTNTVAYVVSKKYGISNVMPILIAEKTGPHFAVGDTCYSHEEDIMTYNPDKKAIVARENEVSALRKSDPAKAYLNCHTDITIPYDELGELTAVTRQGEEYPIIRNGRFVLPGTQELNKPFDE